MEVEIRRKELSTIEEQLDRFDFREEERRVNRELVDQIESRISEINSQIYKFDYDVSEMRSALAQGFDFRIDDVKQIFDETKTYVPIALLKEYEELVTFNRKLTKERNAQLRKQVRSLEKELADLNREATELNERRGEMLRILQNADSFRKFEALQREQASKVAELTYTEDQLRRLSVVRELTGKLRELELDRERAVNEVTEQVDIGTDVSKRVALEFHSLVRRILDLDGSFYVVVNRSGNIEFRIETKLPGKMGPVSSQSEGTSYKKLLCALFDIAY